LVAVVFLAPVLAGCFGAPPTPPAPGTRNLALVIGAMNPLTGALSSLGPSMQNATKLAVKDVNAANLGLTITAHYEDDKTTDSTAAPNTFNSLLAKGVTAIEGPCCSGITGSILDLAKQNQVVVASPSATSPALTLSRDNGGYFWRIAPSDAVQGKVLANLVKGDSVTSVRIVAINNAYGTGLANVFKDTFVAGGGTVDKTILYDEGAVTFASQVTEACAAPRPAGLVMVVYTDEGASILKEMEAQGCRSAFKIFASEGVYDPSGTLSTKAGQNGTGAWLAAGIKGTNPEAGSLTAWETHYKAEYTSAPEAYAAEAYDAVIYIALAAFEANSVMGKDLPAAFQKIANSPGTECSTFAACAALIVAGSEIDYKGYAHNFNFDAKYEPTTGIYSWWEITAAGAMTTIATGKSA
jgi:branched-chain amino acid transport system substrate-binding protein